MSRNSTQGRLLAGSSSTCWNGSRPNPPCSKCNKIISGGRMMLLTWLGVSLGEFECFPWHGSYQIPSNLSSSSPQPPSPGSSDCKLKSPTPCPLSTSTQTELLFPTSAKEVEELWSCSDHSAASHRSQIWRHRGTAVSTSQSSAPATQLWIYSAPPHHHELPKPPCRSFSVTNPIQPGTIPLAAGHRAMLSSPLCSCSLVLLCQRSP